MNEKKKDAKSERPVTSYFLLFTSAFLLAGHFLPWAAHSTAALTQSAHDLSISTNFTPGAGVFLNEWFLLPVWSAALLIVLVTSAAPEFPRIVTFALALGIASLGLPTYPQVLTAYANPDYRLQFFITLAVMASIVLLTIPQGRSVGKWQMTNGKWALTLTLALLSAVPLIGYWVVRPFIVDLYRDDVGIGLGWWVTLIATIALLSLSGGTILRRSSGKASSRP